MPSECPGRVTCARQGLGVDGGGGALRCDIRATPVLLPSDSSGCHTGRVSRVYGNFSYTQGALAIWPRVLPCITVWSRVRGEIRIFRYEIVGTWVFTVLLPCGGKIFAFSTRKSLLTHTVPWCKGGITYKCQFKRLDAEHLHGTRGSETTCYS